MRRVSCVWLALCLGLCLARVSAHPMPNTVIAVSLDDEGVTLDVAVPLSELRLALPASIARNTDMRAEPARSALTRYFEAHCSIRAADDVAHPATVRSISIASTSDADVGAYRELRAQLFIPATPGVDPRDFTLVYDAVIHQVPNHFALVQIAHDLRGGLASGDPATNLGIIHYDFATNDTPSFRVTSESASVWQAWRATARYGFRRAYHALLPATMMTWRWN